MSSEQSTSQEQRLQLISSLYEHRKRARMSKNFVLADEIRAMLEFVGEDVLARDHRVLGPVRTDGGG